MSDDKKKYDEYDVEMSNKMQDFYKKLKNNIKGPLSDLEMMRFLDVAKNKFEKTIKDKKEKDKKYKNNYSTSDATYAKDGGLMRKSKVAGKLAKRGYGKAMKGKK